MVEGSKEAENLSELVINLLDIESENIIDENGFPVQYLTKNNEIVLVNGYDDFAHYFDREEQRKMRGKFRLLRQKALELGYSDLRVICLKELERCPNEALALQSMLGLSA